MTEKEILRLLKENGWVITEGARHHLATHSKNRELRFLSQGIRRTSQ